MTCNIDEYFVWQKFEPLLSSRYTLPILKNASFLKAFLIVGYPFFLARDQSSDSWRDVCRGTRPAELGRFSGRLGSNPAELGSNPAELSSNPAELGSNPAQLGSRPAELGPSLIIHAWRKWSAHPSNPRVAHHLCYFSRVGEISSRPHGYGTQFLRWTGNWATHLSS